jgi:hypothetical protein
LFYLFLNVKSNTALNSSLTVDPRVTSISGDFSSLLSALPTTALSGSSLPLLNRLYMSQIIFPESNGRQEYALVLSTAHNIKELIRFPSYSENIGKRTQEKGIRAMISDFFKNIPDPVLGALILTSSTLISIALVMLIYEYYQARETNTILNSNTLYLNSMNDVDISMPYQESFQKIADNFFSELSQCKELKNFKEKKLFNEECSLSSYHRVLSGEPGWGKTEFTKYIFKKAIQDKLFELKTSRYVKLVQADLNTDYVGQAPARIKKIFTSLKEHAQKNPAAMIMVVFDEIDWFLSAKRLGDKGESGTSNVIVMEVMNALLAEIDRVKQIPNIFIWGTTNEASINLDGALTRAERLQINEIQRPSEGEIKRYVDHFQKQFFNKLNCFLKNYDKSQRSIEMIKNYQQEYQKLDFFNKSKKNKSEELIEKLDDEYLKEDDLKSLAAIREFFNRNQRKYLLSLVGELKTLELKESKEIEL